ncbi:LpqB family beta-propeller domain-containing protein [Actinoplanes sp. GCM10030250]|uniref:LpqB family beta-propeller domain-containing protein n=1 Tax=Actinoplanes sp. GCM10030250 TaxID=3273376 RepID=UPI00360FB2C7
MRRSKPVALLPVATVLVVLGLGGCGIPDETAVTEVGPGPSTGISSGDNDTPAPVTRTTSRERGQFVRNYLEAAAGDYDTALDRVKAFMTPEAKAKFKPATAPRVIRLTGDPLVTPGEKEVSFRYQVIGTLGKNGILEPAQEALSGEYEVTVEESPTDGLFVADAPEYVLLSDTALAKNYAERTIYFWNIDRTVLVPDVRYMLDEVPEEQEPTIILGWLISGPSPLLQDAVERLPEGTATIGKVVPRDNRLEINLNAQAVPTEGASGALDRLRKQLQWSLRHLLPQTLDLKIGHQETMHYSDNDYLSSNPANRLGATPERFVVFEGRVVRLADSLRDEEPVPAIPAAANKDVRTAGLSSSATHTFAALITGSGRGETLRVGGAPFNQEVTLRAVSGLPAGAGYPIWAITPNGTTEGAVGLIVANGRIYSFRAEGGPARQVPWAGGTGRVTAVSVAPDGHRVAFVAGGRLYRAALTVSGDGVALNDPELLHPPLATVTAVGFSSESWLTVAGTTTGRDNRVAIIDVSVDGALQGPRPLDIGDGAVNYLAVYPVNPATNQYHSNSVAFTTGTAAWDALSTAVPIDVGDLASPPADPPAGRIPTAPFYLD